MPRFVRALDVIAVIATLVTVAVATTGGFREQTLFGRISITDWIRPALVAGLVLILRHWLCPRPHLVAQLWRGLLTFWRNTDVRAIGPTFLATRFGVFVIGFFAVAIFGLERPTYFWRIYENEFFNLPARWDTGWYLGVAQEGYVWDPNFAERPQNIAFFPAYPLLIQYTSLLIGRETLWAGVLVSWVSCFAALMYFLRFAREKLGQDIALSAVALLATYPFAIFFSTVYTESLFLLSMVAACYHFERDELWKASLWGLLCGLTRPNGCFLSVVLALLAARPLWQGSWRPRLPPPGGWARFADRIAAASAPGVGMLMFSTYIYFLTGNPFQWVAQNAAWGRVYRGVDAVVAVQSQRLWMEGLYTYVMQTPVDALNGLAVLFALGMIWPVYRRVGLAYAVMIPLTVLPPLAMGGLLSLGRVTAVLFPVFLGLAALVPTTHRTAWYAAFAALQALCAAVFFTWRRLY